MPVIKQMIESLDRIRQQVWDDSLDDSAFDTLKSKSLTLSAQIRVHQVLQNTARYLREPQQHPTFPNPQSRLAKFFDVVFGKPVIGKNKARWEKLRDVDCATFLFIAVSYTPLDITKMSRIEFDYLVGNASTFLVKRELPPRWIFHKDIQVMIAGKADLKEAVDFRKNYYALEFNFPLKGPHHSEHQLPNSPEADDQSNVSEAQGEMLDDYHSSASATVSPSLTEVSAGVILASIKDKRQNPPSPIQQRKRRHIEHTEQPETEQLPTTAAGNDETEPGQEKSYGDVFIVNIDDARQALYRVEDIYEVWLTNLKSNYNANDEKKRSFVTLWISKVLGKELGKRSKLMNATNQQ